MSTGMRVTFGLGLFLAAAGTGYAVTSYEWRGTVMLLVCAVAALYISLVLRGALRRASVPVTPETMEPEEEPHVGPSIWPFVLAIGALVLVLGAIIARWILIPGVILLAGTGVGWFLDIKRQWHPGEVAAVEEATARTGPSGLEAEHQTDHHDRDQH